MKKPALKLLAMAVLGSCGSAHAVICNITATSVPLTTLYKSGTATQVTGTISGSCTRETADIARPYIYIGINQGEPPAGRSMTRQNGTQLLSYEIYHRTYGSGVWTEGTGVTNTSATNGGVLYRMANNATAQAFSFPYYMQIPTPQATAPAGIYDDLAVTATIRLSTAAGSATGAVLAATSFGVSASIQHSCYFSTSPAPLVLNYTSFTASPATASAGFALSCTYNTPYTLVIGPPSTGTLLGLNYSLALSAATGTGSAAPQNFSVNGTVAAGQSGICTTSSCTASQAHTITVGF
ncbi:MAG: spore coat protein U domain-containing protein [Pseudomonadota bacterium]